MLVVWRDERTMLYEPELWMETLWFSGKLGLNPRMPSALAAVFGRNLRAQRERIGLTQAEVAREVGLAVEAYGRLERGQALPRAQTLVAIAGLLETSTDALLGLTEGKRSSLLEDVGAAKGGYRAAVEPELRRLFTRLGKMEPAEIRLFARLAGLVASNRAARKR